MTIKPLPVGAFLAGDDYEVIGILGKGGFGITYLAKDLKLRSTVAVKEYAPADFAERKQDSCDLKPTDVSEFEWGLNRFREEGATLARFMNTPSIVSVARIFDENHTSYLVMEYVDGPNIVKFCESLTSPRQIEALFRDLQIALSSMHEVGFIHSDLKPDNILIRTETSEPVLIDFGSTRQQSVERTMALVTPHYSPVEQYASDTAHGPYTDIYSLSATFYRIITGKRPPDAPTRVLGNDHLLLQGDPTLSAYSADILFQIDAGMMPLPKDRPQSIREWKSLTASKPLKDVNPSSQAVTEKASKQEPELARPQDFPLFSKTLSQAQKAGVFAAIVIPIVAITSYQYALRDTPPGALVAAELNKRQTDFERSTELRQSNVAASWEVTVFANTWTRVGLESKLALLPYGVGYDLRIEADEPFRARTSKGLTIASKSGKDFGLVAGEIYVKNVNSSPQTIEAKLIPKGE